MESLYMQPTIDMFLLMQHPYKSLAFVRELLQQQFTEKLADMSPNALRTLIKGVLKQ